MTWRTRDYVYTGLGLGTAAGLLVWIWRSDPKGPPRRGSLEILVEPDPEPIEPAADLPAVGEKRESYPGAKEPATPAEAWRMVTPSTALEVRSKKRSWATPETADSLEALGDRWALRRNELGLDQVSLRLWDVSKEGGGRVGSHMSHRGGRDADIIIVGATPPVSEGLIVTSKNLPMLGLGELLLMVLEDENVQSIYLDWDLQGQVWEGGEINETWLDLRPDLQYPLPKRRGKTIIRHWDGHRNHIHVRYRK